MPALSLLIFGTFSTACAQKSELSTTAEAPTITALSAHLFLSKSGTLSADVTKDLHQVFLRNSIAGPDAAGTTWVVVEVSGPRGGTFTGYFGPHTRYALRLVAREGTGDTRVLDQVQILPVLNDSGKVYLGFSFRQNGCLPIRLTATLVGARATKPVEQSLNFSCGE